MIADITINEKSFGDKSLYKNVKFSIADGEKIGVVGRNGIGKSTLLNILSGNDKEYSGDVIFRRGVSLVATAQEHRTGEQSALEYILTGLPEYAELRHILNTYPDTMGDDMGMIEAYTEALTRFGEKDFYDVEQKVERELDTFQLSGVGTQTMKSLSGGQKRLVEIVKVMHADSHLALIDEPTNHMDYVAKQQFIDWMNRAPEAMLIITHDRDVLGNVDKIIELADGVSRVYDGNYDAYLRQNAMATSTGMNDFEQIEKRKRNLRQKVTDYQRLKEKSRNPGTIKKFKRLETISRQELSDLSQKEKPTFWVDKESAAALDYKSAARYGKYKAKNIRMNIGSDESRSRHNLLSAKQLTLGYSDQPLFAPVDFDLYENEIVELHGRNGAGKTTLIKAILGMPGPQILAGELMLDRQTRIGIYEQEISDTYLDMNLETAIEKVYLERDLSISHTKIRNLLSDYLFTEADRMTPLSRLSGGQKARFQIIKMLANDPELLILDEPTNHLDLPSIEELELALGRYGGAILYVSHDNYLRQALMGDDGTVVTLAG